EFEVHAGTPGTVVRGDRVGAPTVAPVAGGLVADKRQTRTEPVLGSDAAHSDMQGFAGEQSLRTARESFDVEDAVSEPFQIARRIRRARGGRWLLGFCGGDHG